MSSVRRALCNNRSNGSALGLWSRNANNALSNSNGSNWRAHLPRKAGKQPARIEACRAEP